jgi:hypothetical protein
MDVNEHERLFNITLKVKEPRFHCCTAFDSHSKVFNHDNYSCSYVSVKPPLACS